MQLSFVGLVLKQEPRAASGNYPATTNITFVDTETSAQLVVSSPVPIDPAQMFTPVLWTLSGCSISQVPYKDKHTGADKTFLKISCAAVSGVKK